MLEKQYATPRFAKGDTGLRFTDRSTRRSFSYWEGAECIVVEVVPPSKWDDPSVPEYLVANSRSVAESRGDSILATENELEPA